jgi:hypothetical protein
VQLAVTGDEHLIVVLAGRAETTQAVAKGRH